MPVLINISTITTTEYLYQSPLRFSSHSLNKVTLTHSRSPSQSPKGHQLTPKVPITVTQGHHHTYSRSPSKFAHHCQIPQKVIISIVQGYWQDSFKVKVTADRPFRMGGNRWWRVFLTGPLHLSFSTEESCQDSIGLMERSSGKTRVAKEYF